MEEVALGGVQWQKWEADAPAAAEHAVHTTATADLETLRWLAVTHPNGDGRIHAKAVIDCMARQPKNIDVQRLGLQILIAFLRRGGAAPEVFTTGDTLKAWCEVVVAAMDFFAGTIQIVQARLCAHNILRPGLLSAVYSPCTNLTWPTLPCPRRMRACVCAFYAATRATRLQRLQQAPCK